MSLKEELLAIYHEHGVLTAPLVVDVARDPKHPLHSRFEWNDELAANSYRVEQARALIRTVRVRYVSESSSQASDSVRAFSSVRTPQGGHAYEPTAEVVRDPVKRKILLADMRREWVSMRRRYQSMEEFWELVKNDLPESELIKEFEQIDVFEPAEAVVALKG